MKKKAIIAIMICAALGAAALIYFYAGAKGADKGSANNSEVTTAKVEKGDLRLEVLATGTVVPEFEVVVKSKAGGEITSFPHNEGDVISKGETIVKLDPATEQARTNQAEATLMAARARLSKTSIAHKDAKTKLDRAKGLYAGGIISRQDLEDAGILLEKAASDVKVAEAELAQAKEALREQRERLDDTEVKAPYVGTILKKYVDVGQVISSSLSSFSDGTAIFSMANLDNIYVDAMVDEVDVSRIAVGQDVGVSVDSLPERPFAAVVERVAPKGEVQRTVTVFKVFVRITDKGKELLKPGMTADVRILTEIRKGVVLVPSAAIKLKDKAVGVYVMNSGKPVWTEVKPGATDGRVTEITGDLKPGLEVVTSPMKTGTDKNNSKRRFGFF
ncbi:MAG: efflux RND transporter periplasmic adaptor subunit [Deltaproteobacteria bacterium]|nr:efflux RND transporter periplasmic adaptor subunit [Deltaproteobacteria bacterium]